MSTKQTKSNERQLSGAEIALATVAKWPMAVLDPNRSITELKSSHSTPACCGREVLRSLECVGQAAVNRGSSSARTLVSARKSGYPAAIFQQTSPVAAHQVLASKSTASSSLAVELLSHLLPPQLKNRCMLSGRRIDTVCTNMSPFPSMRGQPCLVLPKNVPGRLAGVCSGIGM